MKSSKPTESASDAKKPAKAVTQPVETSKTRETPKESAAKVTADAKSAAASKPAKETAQTVEPLKSPQPPKKAPAKAADAPKIAAAKKTVQAAKPPTRTKAPEQPEGAQDQPVSAGERQRMIEVAAYLRAERRGFLPGYEAEDWLAAEMEVDQKLGLVTTAE